MIRSNLFVRRAVTTAASAKNFTPCTASTTSSAIDTLTRNYHSSSSTSASINICTPASIHLSTPSPIAIASRQFSTSNPTYNDAATELGSILQREINEEDEASAEYSDGTLPPELADLDAEIKQSWTVLEGIAGIGGNDTESGSGATMRMFRKESGSKGAKIGIVFHCQDTEEDVNFDENSIFDDETSTVSNTEDGEEEEEEPAQAVRFGVTVSKGGKTVVIQCRSGGEGVHVESVAVRDGDPESVLLALAGGENLHAALYQVSFFICVHPIVCFYMHLMFGRII